MKVFSLVSELDQIHVQYPERKIAFIPTMGALHEGHLSLIESAQAEGCVTVVSIFVNPLQFNNPDDLAKYPRTLEEDLQKLTLQGVDVVFTPTAEEMYHSDVEDIDVDLGALDSRFEGACRPGHFHGVVQVVYRLFKFVRPHIVFFGEKDLQQCLVIEQLVQQIFPAIDMRRVATKRETSGLAMSSRNVRLSFQGLKTAASLHQSLNRVVLHRKDFCSVIDEEKAHLEKLGFEIEYLNCVSLPFLDALPCDFFQADKPEIRPNNFAVVVAASIEGVRLIDNQVF